MANGVNYAKYLTANIGTNIGTEYNAQVQAVTDYYEAVSVAAGTDINLGVVPKGSKVVGFILTYDDLGTSVGITISVGSNAAGTASAISAAGCQIIGNSDANSAMTELTADAIVKITTATAAATGTIQLTTLYIPGI